MSFSLPPKTGKSFGFTRCEQCGAKFARNKADQSFCTTECRIRYFHLNHTDVVCPCGCAHKFKAAGHQVKIFGGSNA